MLYTFSFKYAQWQVLKKKKALPCPLNFAKSLLLKLVPLQVIWREKYILNHSSYVLLNILVLFATFWVKIIVYGYI